MVLVANGYLQCKDCGAVFVPQIIKSPCYIQEDDVSPSTMCIQCDYFRFSTGNTVRCPLCGSNDTKKIGGMHARFSKYFRK